jgi:hypothetical protein
MDLIPRIVVALILSIIVTVVLFFGAAAMDGMCHCMESMYTLFPVGSFVMMHYSDTWGFPLTLVQFPVYMLVVGLVRGWRWRLGVAALILVLHIAAASFALHDYCQSRRNCFRRAKPNTSVTSELHRHS